MVLTDLIDMHFLICQRRRREMAESHASHCHCLLILLHLHRLLLLLQQRCCLSQLLLFWRNEIQCKEDNITAAAATANSGRGPQNQSQPSRRRRRRRRTEEPLRTCSSPASSQLQKTRHGVQTAEQTSPDEINSRFGLELIYRGPTW